MSLWDQLKQELTHKERRGFSDRKAHSALGTLARIFGGGYILPNPDAQTSEIVTVPGDPVNWVVFGRWDDGTLDIIREGGMFPQDVLTGWRPGHTVAEYHKALDEEFSDENDPGANGEGADSEKGDRKSLSIVSGSGFRRSERRFTGPKRKAGNNSGGKKAKANRKSGTPPVQPRVAAESVVSGSDSPRKS